MTAYYLCTNGIIVASKNEKEHHDHLHQVFERLKNFEMHLSFNTFSDEPYNCADNLPLTLLSIQNIIKEDISCTPSEIVFGTTLILPDQYFEADHTSQPTGFVQASKDRMNKLSFMSTRFGINHTSQKTYGHVNIFFFVTM